ncbi:MAG: 2-hydroxychromene-2-carboxylate isomerase [Hydrocarboniphaga sp.]|uniref:2-hydroxychromene-2-carboxylate isomerase n=1 Tax=Hydrocarboniphaga sp. TaxID=2033016 RepID=UPI002639FF86|nr:2-hydroxychromene-2-carboxylate isomerase [Hydrocarboniphaga sp.]MDB5969710.1 2-hydroxychromene-2-carboxylate isomerase [Hydrocarboniphaga sp.]
MQADWFFDFVSPFSYLQWPQIRALKGRVDISPRPILFGALLDHLGTVGPAEMPAKRRFTYRMALWQAQQAGRTLRFPPTHPFNPVPALRLCIAAGTTPEAITAIFDWIWLEGRVADSVEALLPLADKLGIADVAAALSAAPVKQSLRDNYDLAVARRVFGVPSIVVGDEVFWGNDATPLFMAWLKDPGVLQTEEMQRVVALPITAQRAAIGTR